MLERHNPADRRKLVEQVVGLFAQPLAFGIELALRAVAAETGGVGLDGGDVGEAAMDLASRSWIWA